MIRYIKKHLMYLAFAVMCIIWGLVYFLYSAPVRAVTDDNPTDSVGEMVVNTKVTELQDELQETKSRNRYLSAITPLIVVKKVEDVTKIQILQDKLDDLNRLSVKKETYENLNENYQDKDYPVAITEPILLPPKKNILHEIMLHGGSYTEAYKKAQREGH